MYEKLFCSSELTGRTNKQLICLIVVNIFLSITASLGNTLILIALHKESFLHPPSKLLFRCLATTDLCVGIIAEPLVVTYWMSVVTQRWNICCYAQASIFVAGHVLCSVSLLTLTAISVDRLLALLLGLRYRELVTLKRTYASMHNCFMDCLYCRFNNLLSKLLNDLKVWVYRCIIVDSYLNFLLRKNYSYSPSSSKSSTQSGSASRAEPKNSAEHIEIQKGSVQCTVAAVDISCLLSTLWYSCDFDDSKRAFSASLSCKASCTDFNFLELIIKSDSLLLEDERRQTSSEGHSQKMFLFIKLVTL